MSTTPADQAAFDQAKAAAREALVDAVADTRTFHANNRVEMLLVTPQLLQEIADLPGSAVRGWLTAALFMLAIETNWPEVVGP